MSDATSFLPDALANFHWLRPWALLLIPVALVCCYALWRRQSNQSQWQQVIAPELLPHLLQGPTGATARWPIYSLAGGLIIAAFALAGPSWEKLPQPVHQTQSAMVVLLDLSPSMMAQDIKPSRLVRARLKLIDLLQQRQEGLTALVVYAGEAHTVTPITDDADTIISLLPSLSPSVMPLSGSNTEMAVEKALQLLHDANLFRGELLIVTDGMTEEALQTVDDTIPSGIRLSILGVGTDDGAPIPLGNGGFAKDNSGNMVLAKLNRQPLAQLARNHSGRYTTLAADDSDLRALTQQSSWVNPGQTKSTEREFDSWLDRGPWLTLLLLPLMLLAFRRGWIVALLPLVMFPSEQAQAIEWQDLWQTPDQQAQKLLQQGDTSKAAETFENPNWKATANYKAGNYEQAAKLWAQENSASSHYNQGNAYAKAGKLQQAIDAYEKALTADPTLKDAKANQQLAENLLKQQQEQQQKQGSDSNQDSNQQDNDSDGQQKQSDNQQSSETNNQENSSGKNGSNESNSKPSDTDKNSGSSDQQGETQQPSSDKQPTPSEGEKPSDEKDTNINQDNQQGLSHREQQEHTEEAETASASEQLITDTDSGLSDEEKQAMEQWLRKIPDDPSGLMRNKFEYQYRERRKAYQEGTWQPPENNANQRW